MKINRNAACPCGSGKKYKHCCGNQRHLPTLANDLNQALRAFQSERFAEVEALTKEILARSPNNLDALQLRALTLSRLGNVAESRNCFELILKQAPNNPAIHNNYGLILKAAKEFDAAEKHFRMAIDLNPQYAEAYNNLGNMLDAKGEQTTALNNYLQAVKYAPQNPLFHFNLGAAYEALKMTEEAEKSFCNAIASDSGFVAAYNSLGFLKLENRFFYDAVRWFSAAENHGDTDPKTFNGLGLALLGLRRWREAIDYFQRAIQGRSDFAYAYSNLGLALQGVGEDEKARTAYEQAIALDPQLSTAYKHLFNLLTQCGELDCAYQLLQQSCNQPTDFTNELPTLASILGDICDFEGRERLIALFGDRMDENNIDMSIVGNMFLHLNYTPSLPAKKIFQYHLKWGKYQEQEIKNINFEINRSSVHNKRLRVGYVSADFRSHSVGYFFRPLIGAHDKSFFSVYCYYNSKKNDAITDEIKSHADCFRFIADLNDQELARQINDDQIDILIDLSGHTGGTRLGAFVYKPAPVQVSYLGYPNTTGLSQMDYRISDSYAEPSDIEGYVEKVLQLPESFLCFEKFPVEPDKNNYPFERNGYVTFASFNSLSKITPSVVHCWAEVLQQTPNSKLIIKGKGAGSIAGKNNLHTEFNKYGIAAERLLLVDRLDSETEHLRFYNNVDIALDTFPYNGTTTTCQALWMGVPVVALMGAAHVGRVSYSILSNCGLTETIAGCEKQYVKIAATLAQDLNQLAALRQSIPNKIRNSILCQPKRFTQQLEILYKQIAGWSN